MLQSVNTPTKAFLVSIGYAKPFGVINFVLMGLFVLFGWITIIKLEMPTYGFAICKAVSELCVFFLCIILMYRLPNELKSKIDWKEYKEKIFGFLCGS